MRLLVSVRNAEEAAAAIDGGADIVDAKEPDRGALGAVSMDAFRGIVGAVAGARPVTAALGDAADERAVERLARAFVGAGADLIKVGFADLRERHRAAALLASAARGAGPERVIAVAYADHERASSLRPVDVLHLAAAIPLAGILLDTADKRGPGLPGLMPLPLLVQWVVQTRKAGLLAALAGQLTFDDVVAIAETGADIAGVRGAACDGGRGGPVSVGRVRLLRQAVQVRQSGVTGGAPGV